MPLSLDLITGGSECGNDVLAVGFIADFEHELDADATEWGEPDGAAMVDVDDIGAGSGDAFDQLGEISGAVGDGHLEQHIASLANEHLLDDACEQIAIDVAAAEWRANDIVGFDMYFASQQSGDACGAGAFDDEVRALHAM